MIFHSSFYTCLECYVGSYFDLIDITPHRWAVPLARSPKLRYGPASRWRILCVPLVPKRVGPAALRELFLRYPLAALRHRINSSAWLC